MSIRFDDKGKFFTDIISKESVPVIIQTLTNRVQGKLHIRPNTRLKDEINKLDPFFAVTEASIYDPQGELLFKCDFFTINREHIVWVLPEDQITDTEKTSGGVS